MYSKKNVHHSEQLGNVPVTEAINHFLLHEPTLFITSVPSNATLPAVTERCTDFTYTDYDNQK